MNQGYFQSDCGSGGDEQLITQEERAVLVDMACRSIFSRYLE